MAHEELALLLKEVRRGQNLTQVSLAERLGKPQSFVAKIERGERSVAAEELIFICAALGTDPAAILEWLRIRIEKRAR